MRPLLKILRINYPYKCISTKNAWTELFLMVLKNTRIIPIRKPEKDDLLAPCNWEDIRKECTPKLNQSWANKNNKRRTVRIAKIVDQAKINFNTNKVTHLAALNIEKAYDMVWRVGMIYKMSSYNIPGYITKTIILWKRNDWSDFQGKLSRKLETAEGLPPLFICVLIDSGHKICSFQNVSQN